MKQCYFAVDLGATSGRTIIGEFTSKGVEIEEVNRFPNHLIEVGGHFYWDIYELYRNILNGLKLAAQKTDLEICSIGIDTWGVDFVCVGKDSAFLRLPYAYRDPQTVGAPERFFKSIPRSSIYKRTGIQVMNFNTLFQLDTLQRNHDSALQAANKLLFMPDALSYLLTGQIVTEYTIASTSQLLNAYTRQWEDDLLKEVGLTSSHFGRFVYPGTCVGVITSEVQQITGLKAIPVIAVAGHDTASAVAAVPALDNHFAYLSSGTWSLMGIEVDEPIINAETERLNFTNEGGINGTIRLLKNICGMWLLERCRIHWPEVSYLELIAEADNCEPFRSLINPDDLYFSNPENMEQAIRTYCVNTCQPIPVSRGQLVRCIFESLALRYRQVLESLCQLSPHPIKVLHVIGGGSRNERLNQWTANAIGLPVISGPSEATGIGNLMIQACTAKNTNHVASMRKLIRSCFPLKTFLPEEPEAWEAAYHKFLSVIN